MGAPGESSGSASFRSLRNAVRSDALLRSTAVVLALTAVANALAYLYQLAMGRLLEPAEFAYFSAILATVAIISSPFSAIPAAVAHATSRGGWSSRSLAALIGRVLAAASVLGILAGAILVVAGPALSRMSSDTLVLTLAAVSIAIGLPASVFLGLLQGEQRFAPLGLVILAATLARFVVGVGLVVLGAGVAGGIAGNVVRTAVLLVAGLVLTRWRPAPPGEAPPVRDFVNMALLLAVGLLAFDAMTNADVVAAKLFLPEAAASDYAGAAVLAKAIVFISTAVTVVLFPKAARLSEDEAAARRLLARALAYTIGLSAVAAGVVLAFPELLIRVALGDGYPGAARILPWLAIAAALLGVFQVFVMHALATRRLALSAALAGAALVQVGLLGFFHATPMQVVAVVGATAACGSLVAACLTLASGRYRL